MPIVPLKLIPTVNSEKTAALNESGISSCNLIRFKAGLPEKLGGWEKFAQFSVSGIPRDIHPWQDLNNTQHLGIGTVGTGTLLGVITTGSLQDITRSSSYPTSRQISQRSAETPLSTSPTRTYQLSRSKMRYSSIRRSQSGGWFFRVCTRSRKSLARHRIR